MRASTSSFGLLLLLVTSGRVDAALNFSHPKRFSAGVSQAGVGRIVGPSTTVLAASIVAGSYGQITSTFRTLAHNRDVGGMPNSYHLHGQAIDVARRPGVTHRQIAEALRSAGYALVESLDEGDHSHFAFANRSPAIALSAEAPEPIPRLLADDHGVLRLSVDLTAGAGKQGAP